MARVLSRTAGHNPPRAETTVRQQQPETDPLELVTPPDPTRGSAASTRWRFYVGRSMAGTFRTGDLLHVEPARIDIVATGDVVVYRSTAAGASIESVHRVVGRTAEGLRTRGDDNSTFDELPVDGDSLIGRVTSYERRGVARVVRGGRLGLAQARVRRLMRNPTQRKVARALLPPYLWLQRTKIARLVWRPDVMRVWFEVNGQKVVKFICGGRTVAQWWPHSGCFVCRRPFDLVLSPPKERARACRVD